ncbi:MAG TPA: cyclodeaminase/cyclohydrolase family protein [Candidatus Limnocylindria bacterium]|nr:cyclodeaminase/cyclohydrolase family protein [Candidatus Limnocylindria bacterium]
MNEHLVERTLRAFSDDLASSAAVPGGGSAAAYAGAMGAALAAMVGRIAERKQQSEATTALISEADNLRSDFIRLVDDDSAAFARVSEAMKMPKATEEDKHARTERIQSSLLAASRVPLEIARTSRRLLDLCERTVQTAASATVSDVGVGALLAETALRGAALNVMINLASVKDAAQVKSLSEDLDGAVDGAEEQRKRITDFVESRIAR